MKSTAAYKQQAQACFFQTYQGGYLNFGTAMLIDNEINNLLEKDNILRSENIPNEEQVINEEDHILNNQEDDEFYKDEDSNEAPSEGIQNDENLDEDDLQQRND